MKDKSLHSGLILASSSKYRRTLLERLSLPFDCRSPEIDETAENGELPLDLVKRLARRKAELISTQFPGAIVIGSDQVAVFNNRIIGKPGNYSKAQAQLASFSGQVVEFLTAVSVQSVASKFHALHTDRTRVYFRKLQPDEIDRYLDHEKPFDCAGAFKAEALGITLFERISSDDPTAIIGLPLIRTAAMLREAGLQLP
jgi:septum formation protein